MSLKTQIVKKSSELNFIHGFYIFHYLKKYVEKNNVKPKIHITDHNKIEKKDKSLVNLNEQVNNIFSK